VGELNALEVRMATPGIEMKRGFGKRSYTQSFQPSEIGLMNKQSYLTKRHLETRSRTPFGRYPTHLIMSQATFTG
jgi:hypothetical protein